MSFTLNLVQAIITIIGVCVLSVPTGWLCLRAARLIRPAPVRRSLALVPVAAVVGLLVLPLVYNTLGVVFGVPLDSGARVLIWLALNAALFLVGGMIPRDDAALDPTTLFTARWQAWALAAAGLLGALMTLPMFVHNAPVPGYPADDPHWYRNSVGDWEKHYGMGTGLSLDDHFPPDNPFVSTEPRLRYYYFAYVLPATIHNIVGGLTVANTQLALPLIVALFLPSLVFAFGRQVGMTSGGALASSLVLTLVGGLDVLPTMILLAARGQWVVAHVDSWLSRDRRINSINNSIIWVPQHILGLMAVIVILWFLHGTLSRRVGRTESARIVGTAVMLAALAGTSALVWFGLGVGLGVYVLVELVQSLRQRDAFRNVLIMAAVLSLSLVLTVPFLLTISGRDESPFMLGATPTMLFDAPTSILTPFLGATPLTYALELPIQLMPDLGLELFVGLAGWWMLRRHWSSSADVRLWTAVTAAALVVVLVMTSNNFINDISMRVAPIAWVVLGVFGGFWWAARHESRWWRWRVLRALLVVMLVIGIGSTLFEPGGMIVKYTLTPAYHINQNERGLYDWLNANLERDDVYVYRVGADLVQRLLYFVEHKTAISYPEFTIASLYSAGQTLVDETENTIKLAYRTLEAPVAYDRFRSVDIDYVVMSPETRTAILYSVDDPRFGEYFELVYENPLFKVYALLPENLFHP